MTRKFITGLMLLALLSVPATGLALAQGIRDQGITLPAGMTLGPYGTVIPASQAPTPLPVGPNSTAGPNVPGGMGMMLPPGMTLGPYGSIVPAGQTMPTAAAGRVPAGSMPGKPAATATPVPTKMPGR